MFLSDPGSLMEGPQGTEAFPDGFRVGQPGLEITVHGGLVEFSGKGSVVKYGAGVTNIPVIGMCLHLNQFDITQLFQIEGFGALHPFGHNPVDPS